MSWCARLGKVLMENLIQFFNVFVDSDTKAKLDKEKLLAQESGEGALQYKQRKVEVYRIKL